jgi:hypothetical protein
MIGVTGVLVAVFEVVIVEVASMGVCVGPAGSMVPTGAGDVCVDIPQAEVKQRTINTPIKLGREIFFIHKSPSSIAACHMANLLWIFPFPVFLLNQTRKWLKVL